MTDLPKLLEAQGEDLTAKIAPLLVRKRNLQEEIEEVDDAILKLEVDRKAIWAAMDVAIRQEKEKAGE